MKRKSAKYGLTIALLMAVLTLCSACGEDKVSMSKSLYVVNETDVTLESLLLDVEGKPLADPLKF